jgi:hypothetical protein
LDKECIDRTKSAVERVAMAGAKVILMGSLAIGLLLPEYEGPLHPSDVASAAPLANREQDPVYRSGGPFIAPIHAQDGAIAAVLPREHDGLHDHREGESMVVKLASPIIVTGAGLSGQPDL